MYTCKRCGYESEYKHCLQNHFKRKVICKVIDEDISIDILLDELVDNKDESVKTYDCEYCGKKFNKCSNKSRHKNICKKKPKDTETIVNELSEQVKKLQSKIDESQIPNTTQNITNNTQNNNTQNITNINVKLKDFGRENMDAVPDSLMSYLFMELRFRDLLSQLHCDPNFPENQNIRIRSVKGETLEIFRNNKWDIVSFSKGLQELLLQGHRIFKDFYKKDKERILEEDMDETDLKEILSQLQKIEDLNKTEIKPLIEDLQMMLEEFKITGSAIVTL